MSTPQTFEDVDLVMQKLLDLMKCGPGRQPALLGEARKLTSGWQCHPHRAIRRSATDVRWAFEDWFSARRWEEGSDRGETARTRLSEAIARLYADLVAYYGSGKGA